MRLTRLLGGVQVRGRIPRRRDARAVQVHLAQRTQVRAYHSARRAEGMARRNGREE